MQSHKSRGNLGHRKNKPGEGWWITIWAELLVFNKTSHKRQRRKMQNCFGFPHRLSLSTFTRWQRVPKNWRGFRRVFDVTVRYPPPPPPSPRLLSFTLLYFLHREVSLFFFFDISRYFFFFFYAGSATSSAKRGQRVPCVGFCRCEGAAVESVWSCYCTVLRMMGVKMTSIAGRNG